MKEASKLTISKSVRAKDPHPYVVPEDDIAEFINSLRINDLRTVAARFLVVADLTSGNLEERKDQLTSRDLRLIEQIAREDNNKHYRPIMKEIIVGVGKGRYGINAVHLTATVAVGMIFDGRTNTTQPWTFIKMN